MSTTLRVAQWATGNIGTRSLRAIIEHPEMELVGLWVHSEAKEGVDAGDLCGVDKTGVVATRSVDDIVGLHADCVLYMPQETNIDELCALLESGTNVVTTRGDFHWPESIDPAARERIESACTRGLTSIHSTGSSPGFITEAVPLVLSSIQRRIDGLVIDEFADLASRDSPTLLFELMGYGKDPAKFDRRRWAHGAASFGPSLRSTAHALGLPLDAVESTGEVAVTPTDLEIAAGTIPAGTVAAQRMTVTGSRRGRPLLTFRANWYCTTELEPAWDLRPTGWRLVLDGDAPMDVEIRFTVPLERMAETTPGYTAHRAINAVGDVCAAAPGIRTTPELPNVFARLTD